MGIGRGVVACGHLSLVATRHRAAHQQEASDQGRLCGRVTSLPAVDGGRCGAVRVGSARAHATKGVVSGARAGGYLFVDDLSWSARLLRVGRFLLRARGGCGRRRRRRTVELTASVRERELAFGRKGHRAPMAGDSDVSPGSEYNRGGPELRWESVFKPATRAGRTLSNAGFLTSRAAERSKKTWARPAVPRGVGRWGNGPAPGQKLS